MAELTHLDEKLAEVIGLAQAAQVAAKRVTTLARHEDLDELVSMLETLSSESAELERSCQSVADTREGKKTAIEDKARDTKTDLETFMRTYLEDAEALDGLEFLSMAEAGELAHWEILATLNQTADDQPVAELVDEYVPQQRTHVERVREQALSLASDEDPFEES
jgi:hypothetical protein